MRRALRTWYQVDASGPVYGDPRPSQIAAITDGETAIEAGRRRLGVQPGDVKVEDLVPVLQAKSDTMNGGVDSEKERRMKVKAKEQEKEKETDKQEVFAGMVQ